MMIDRQGNTLRTGTPVRLFLGSSIDERNPIGIYLRKTTGFGAPMAVVNVGKDENSLKYFDNKLNTKLTENEYMRLAGFMKIYDCGQSVFVLEHK